MLHQKVTRLVASVLQPEEVLAMACRNGAYLVDQGDDLGAVEPGRKADLVVVDLSSPFVAPVHRVPSALVYCTTPRDVLHVMVNGHLLLRDRRLTRIDEEVALRRAEEAARRVCARAGISTRLA